jgi:hypothetical protein
VSIHHKPGGVFDQYQQQIDISIQIQSPNSHPMIQEGCGASGFGVVVFPLFALALGC